MVVEKEASGGGSSLAVTCLGRSEHVVLSRIEELITDFFKETTNHPVGVARRCSAIRIAWRSSRPRLFRSNGVALSVVHFRHRRDSCRTPDARQVIPARRACRFPVKPKN